MPERTEIEKYARWLIASDIVYRPLKSLGEKGLRRLNKIAISIVDLLEKGEEEGERVFARIEISEKEKARTLNEGIEKFTQQYPRYGQILRGIIAEKRLERDKCLVYGLKPDYKLGEEDYLKVMVDLGFSRREASSIYPHIIAVSERMGKEKESAERSMLIPNERKKQKKR